MNEERWNAVDAYLVDATVGSDAALERALATSAAAGLPAINVAPNQGKMLSLLAQLGGARRILEVGTLGGYSTIWLARGLPPHGRLITLELSRKHAAVARENVDAAGVGARVEIRTGPALESLERLQAEGGEPFDFTFIDADKVNTRAYFRHAVAMSRPGAAIVVDNVVRDGAILDPHGDESARGMRAFFADLANEPRVNATAVQTVGSKGHDGFALAIVRG
jgi:predicted O-methyltransferase YrrM